MSSERDFEKEMEEMYLNAMENLADVMTERAAENMANMLIQSIEEDLTNPIAIARKPYIYWKVIQILQKKLESISGDVKVEE